MVEGILQVLGLVLGILFVYDRGTLACVCVILSVCPQVCPHVSYYLSVHQSVHICLIQRQSCLCMIEGILVMYGRGNHASVRVRVRIRVRVRNLVCKW